jgi:hypothetical protein
MQKFSSHMCSEFLRILVLPRFVASLRCERDYSSQQNGGWCNSVWHLVQISLTID